MLRVSTALLIRVWLAVPETTEWKRIGNSGRRRDNLCVAGLRAAQPASIASGCYPLIQSGRKSDSGAILDAEK